MATIVLIPARYASTRFPGKPLARLAGKTIIERVVERVAGAGFDCAVATDDARIFDFVTGAGFRAVMTGTHHRSGTDRIREALDSLEHETGRSYDIVINVQGDEPFIDASQIRALEKCFDDPATDIATLCRPFPADGPVDDLLSPNLVKVVRADDDSALYFSRSLIPFPRGVEKREIPAAFPYTTHIGIYGYRAGVLRRVTELSASPLEAAESLEQLRWLQAGYRIACPLSHCSNIGIDTPEDLAAAEEFLSRRQD